VTVTLSALPAGFRDARSTVRAGYCAVADLAALGLRPVEDVAVGNSAIEWVIETELADPTPVVVPGALVLTRGSDLTDAGIQVAHVMRLKRAGAVCLGWADGHCGSEIPPATVRAAREFQLSLVTVPNYVSFAEVSAFVAQRLAFTTLPEERGPEAARQCALLELATAGVGTQATITELSRSMGRPLRLVGTDGFVLAQYPPQSATADDDTAEARPDEIRRPVVIDGLSQAHLVTTGPPKSASMLRFAVALVAMELTRSLATVGSHRRLLGQVVKDVVGQVLSDEEARRRLSGLGLDVEAAHTVVLANVGSTSSSLLDLSSPVEPASGPVAGCVDGGLCFFLPGDSDAEEFAMRLYALLRPQNRMVSIGIGATLQGVAGLRTSYLEAREGTTRGPGVNPRRALTLTGLLRAQESPSLSELAREVLNPLFESDNRSQTDLVSTLRVLLAVDFSVARAAEELFVHRNTVKYRVSQIERLTGLDLSCTADRVQLWVAMSAAPSGS
jgi:purine catabolism regulator